jgi:acetyl esterase/lipase
LLLFFRKEDLPLMKRIAAPVTALILSACSPAQLLNATVPEGGLTITRDIAYGTLPRESLDIYRPRGVTPATPVVVFFYGGSWNSGSKTIYPFVAATLARAGMVVVVPDYRVYPAVTYPGFLHDCAQAVAWTEDHPAQTGSGPLFLMGHSAGAYNAAMLALDPTWLRSAGARQDRVAGLIGLAGPYDFLPITDPEIIPIFPHAGPDTQPITYAGPHAPPALLLAGTDDETVRPRNSQALAAKLKANGDDATLLLYKGLGHIGLVTAIAPAFQWRAPVLRDILEFIRRVAAAPQRPGMKRS